MQADVTTLIALLSAITAFLGFLLKAYLDLRKDRREEDIAKDKLAETLSDIGSSMIEIKQATEETKSWNKKIARGLMHSQRFTLQAELNEALLRNYTTQHEFDEINKMYESYVALGGNGTIRLMFERFSKLELKEEI